MKEKMTVKELKEFLNQFPDDAIVCTDTDNHYDSEEGIVYATLVECEDDEEEGKEQLLFLGNTRHVGKLLDGIGKYEMHEYNLSKLKIIKALSIWDNNLK